MCSARLEKGRANSQADGRSGNGVDDQDCEVQTSDAGVLCHCWCAQKFGRSRPMGRARIGRARTRRGRDGGLRDGGKELKEGRRHVRTAILLYAAMVAVMRSYT